MPELQKLKLTQAGELATLQEHQSALYYLLQEFDRVCKELNIKYFLFAGTLLGAVRHKGFIPWDDDLDVLMCREDYRRFLQEAPQVLNQEKFFLQKEYSEHFPMFFSKLRLNGTTCLEKYFPKDPLVHQGVYMDIFPCDNAYNSKVARYFQFVCSKVVIAKGLDAEGYDTDSMVKKIVILCSRFLPGTFFHRIVQGPRDAGMYVHCFLGGASKISRSVFRTECFSEYMRMPFENACFSVPVQYDEVLKVLYSDYWKIPPEEDRKCKEHAILVDLTQSYEFYKSYRDGMKFHVHTRSIR